MKIVFLDGYTVNPGDISWNELSELGDLTVYDRTEPENVLERAKDAEVLIVNKTGLQREHFEQLPSLKLVCVAAAGYDRIDVQSAAEHGVWVCNAAGYGSESVAQMFFSLLLELTNRVGHYARANRNGFWSKSPDFCCWNQPLIELWGKRLAIVGFGRIGEVVARMAHAFGMQIVAVTHRKDLPEYVTPVTVDEAFKTCDVVSLNAPLTAENRHFVNTALLGKAKPGLLLINTARGALVDELAVVEALKSGILGGYAADVMEHEPPCENHPFWTLENVFITPHIAWVTTEARMRLMKIMADNIRGYLTGRLQNVVNK